MVSDSKKEAEIFFNDISSNIKIISETPEFDFSILFSAKKLIVALSTFSWWAGHCLTINSNIIINSKTYEYLGFYRNDIKLEIINI